MIGNSILARRCFIVELVCQEALSRSMVEFSYQPGVSKSSYLPRYRKNVVMTSASVFAWVRANHILPSVSKAASKEILGATYLSV